MTRTGKWSSRFEHPDVPAVMSMHGTCPDEVVLLRDEGRARLVAVHMSGEELFEISDLALITALEITVDWDAVRRHIEERRTRALRGQ